MPLELLLVLLGVPLLVLVLAAIPYNRWRLELSGHAIEVVNHGGFERVFLDGERLPDTRADGNHMTWALHRFELPNGELIEVHVSTQGAGVACQVYSDGEQVWDSQTLPLQGGKRRQGASPLADRAEVDARQSAAEMLLAELAGGPDARVAEASRSLAAEVDGAFDKLASARGAAAAHATLGAADDEVEALIEHREGELQSLLDAVRALHMAATSSGGGQDAPLPDVHRLIDSLHEEQAAGDEVEAELQRRRAAARLGKPIG